MKYKFEEIKIAELGDIITGMTPPTNDCSSWNGEYSFYSPSDFNNEKYCNETARTVTEKAIQKGRFISKNAILFTCIASIGKMAIAGKDGITNQQINSIVPNKQFYSDYIYYILRFFSDKIQRIAPSSAVQIINKSEFENISIYGIKDIKVQQHIADILTSCDEVIEQTEKAIAKYQAIKTGMLQDLFTRGVDANGKLRPAPEEAPELYKDSPLGKIPKEWEINSIGNLFDLEVGGDLNKNYFSCFKTAIHKYPIFSNSLENSGLYGYTSFPNYPAESITLTGRGSLGHAEYRTTPFDAIIRLVVLKTKEKNAINCKFVTEQLNYDKDFFIESTGVPQLTAPQTAKMRIRIPSRYSEQQTIASHLFAIDEKIAIEKQTLQKYIAIKQGLMKKLLTPPEGALEYEKAQ